MEVIVIFCNFQPTKKQIEEQKLTEHMPSGPVIPMVWEGSDIIELSHRLIGNSNPLEAMSGTIRGDFSTEREHNLVHSAHSREAAEKEISLWFHEKELIDWKSTE